ncbi:penicillin-binding protein 1B [Photobacterium aquimaris]|uniref:Penicillin-binding protein 1B n=1 Tax=Photobacterium aquimaris TaxID=512643 RepID=A0A2T3IIP2_9GAMM|nr:MULTISPECIES: penicillin-binding protein 1B [Photobacterium]OBU12554.1 penicillin-binding protein 1B [Photobacterium aquimaris]OBU15294.1 penicillin-binding protein 1B [Photobacterium aquimaris]PSU28209.1 penicillin-binding protein 1B [Photobacterium aquimaris]PSW00141.1 penicillin-binding protein 1B [Photobacterium aquimaris]
MSKSPQPPKPQQKKPAAARKKAAVKPTAKKQPAKKAAPKKATSKKTASKKFAGSHPWLRKLGSLGLKMTLVGVAILLVIGIYLDTVVRNKMDGPIWDLPSVVYGRVLTLHPGQALTISDVRRELDVLQYHKVRSPRKMGEYSASSTRIELIRRPFKFVDGSQPQQHVMLTFTGAKLASIVDVTTNRPLKTLRIEPKLLGMLGLSGNEQRIFMARDQFPPLLIDALLTTEDRDFYEHDGVSPLAILRAMVVNLKAGHTVQGGSTLTQQLAKNLFLSRERSLWRKVREAYIAVIIDHRYSKDRVLEAYLNEIYLGQNGAKEIHGFPLAARFYFGRPLEELRVDQLAMLVGMVKGPSQFNPWRHPERTLKRRDLVLSLLAKNDYLTEAQYEQAFSEPLGVQKTAKIASRQPAYFQQLQRELQLDVGDIYKSGKGLRIFSTLDPLSQQAAEKTIATMVPRLNKKAGVKVETAMVVVDRQDGAVRALIGGSRPGYAGFNRALDARRQIGSLAKPAVYLAALSQPQKFSLATTLNDQAIVLKGSKGTSWRPRNYDRKFRGQVPLYYALAYSLNVPTVNLGLKVGLNTVINTIAKLGVNRDQVPRLPSILLGAFSLSPFEVAQMFQSITNHGRKAPLYSLDAVVDSQGRVLYQHHAQIEQVVPEQAAWLTTYDMKRVVSQGTARFLQTKFSSAKLAGKTGTTDNNRDSWFAGADGREVGVVWVGRDDNTPVRLTGSSGALRVYADYLARRQPLPLNIGWPPYITTVKYQRTANGSLRFDCNGNVALPAWDKNGDLKAKCQDNQPATWIKHMFAG